LVWHRWFRDRPEEHTEVNAAELALIRMGAQKNEAELHAHHVPWRILFTSRNLAVICAMYFAYAYSLYFYLTWLPTYLIKARGFTPAYAKWYSALPWVLSIGTFWFGGWLTDRLARTHGLKLARCGVGACGYGLSGLLLLAVPQVQSRVLAAVLLALSMCCQAATISAAWAVCLDVGRRNAGVVTGFMNSFGNIGGTIAPIVVVTSSSGSIRGHGRFT
jgi:nitrate/nitrite transporter NarK